MKELISREDLLYNLSQYLFQESPRDDFDEERIRVSGAIKECMKAIEESPTIESRPSGKWIEIQTPWTELECSNCKTSYGMEFIISVKPRNYCPNCGAEMEQ